MAKRPTQVLDDYVGPRCEPSRRSRLREDIAARGGHEELWRTGRVPVSKQLFFVLGYRKGINRNKLITFARFMGRADAYYIGNEQARDSVTNIPLKQIRYTIAHQVTISDIEYYTKLPNGQAEVTDLRTVAATLAKNAVFVGYEIAETVPKQVCKDLVRDGFARFDPTTGKYVVAPLTLDELRGHNIGRLGMEWAYHEHAIDRIVSKVDADSREVIVERMGEAIEECEDHLETGKHFTEADRLFHHAVIEPCLRPASEPLFQACEQSYMKRRQLAKFVYGDGVEYTRFMKEFNTQQLAPLKTIFEEYRGRSRPRKNIIRKALKEHTDFQIKAWHDCETLSELVKQYGDRHDQGC